MTWGANKNWNASIRNTIGDKTMNKLQWILIFTLPAVRSAATYLRMKDANSEGKDDQAADALMYAADFVESLVSGSPTPDLPKSLRPKMDVVEESEDKDTVELKSSTKE